MKKIYILVQHYEADFEYSYNIPEAAPYFAYESENDAKQEKIKFEKLNNANKDGIWQEDDCRCYFTIEETELIQDK